MKNAIKTSAFAAVCLFSTHSMAASTAVDLSSWLAEGTTSFNWNVEPGNNGVKQTRNGNPTVFHNNTNSQGLALSGTIEVQTTGDNDYIGFVLGYNAGDFSNASADYILIDWKQTDQNSFGGTAERGLAISRVSGILDNDSGAWWHDATDGVEELQRGATLFDTGWANNTEYEFDLVFTSTLIEVFVDGNKELCVNGMFNNGSFGFYNYSQANVRYAGLEESVLPPPPPSEVPLPAAVWLFGSAMMGFVGMRRKQKTA